LCAAPRGDELPEQQRIADLVAEHRLAGCGSVTFGDAGSPVALTPEARLVLYRAGGNGQTTRLTGQGSRVNVTAPPAGHG